jgi:hypothetical protein
MAPFPTPTLTVLAVLITPLESLFPSWITIGFSVVCVVMLGEHLTFSALRRLPRVSLPRRVETATRRGHRAPCCNR